LASANLVALVRTAANPEFSFPGACGKILSPVAAMGYAVANIRTVLTKEHQMSNPTPTTPIELHYEIYGAGKPVLCIHGFGASLFSWRNFVAPVSAGYQLILIDLKGSGKSPKPPDSDYSPQHHADLIYKFIIDHNLSDLTLVGNSFGGALSLLLTLMLMDNQPGRLRGLILIDPGAYKQFIPGYVKLIGIPVLGALAVYLLPAKLMAKSILKLAYYDKDKITAPQIAAYAAPIASPGGKHALIETGKQIIPPNIDELTARYKDINVPTLIIWGKQDKIISPQAGDLLAHEIAGSILESIDLCGHVPQEEKPEATVPLVLNFLQSL
jgi:pimeloyl-ACP methyl ester carboxylesterase